MDQASCGNTLSSSLGAWGPQVSVKVIQPSASQTQHTAQLSESMGRDGGRGGLPPAEGQQDDMGLPRPDEEEGIAEQGDSGSGGTGADSKGPTPRAFSNVGFPLGETSHW